MSNMFRTRLRQPKSTEIEYSARYNDDHWVYRHVSIPERLLPQLPDRLLHEDEWRAIGVIQSRGWENYLRHEPEPHVLLFRRPKGSCNQTGKAMKGWKPPIEENIPTQDALDILKEVNLD